jgi:hypothetical protein
LTADRIDGQRRPVGSNVDVGVCHTRRAFAARQGGRALLAVSLGLLCLGARRRSRCAASSDEGPSNIAFTVPNQAAIENLQKLGYDLAEDPFPHHDGTIEINAIVTPEQKA